MTTDASTLHTVMPASSGFRQLVDEVRAIPVRFLVVACVGALLVLAGGQATPVEPYFSPDDSVQAFIGALWRLGYVLLAFAPLLALRWPLGATALAILPAPLIVFEQHAWPFIAFVALVAVAMVSTWRSLARALVPAALALLGIAVLLSGSTVMVMPYGAEIGFGYGGGPGTAERLLTFAMYLAAVLILLGIAWAMRAGAVTSRRSAELEARSAAVEGQATVLGERARLARDLHDVVAHHVSLIAVRAETAPYTYPDLSREARDLLGDIATDARGALEELRGVLGVLRRAEDGAPELAPQPQLTDIAALVEAARAAGEDVTLSGALDVAVGSAPQYVAYRVVQEALTNARRHAPGQPVEIAVHVQDDALRVRVSTPYSSPPASSAGAGQGLHGMRERVEALGGSLTAEVRSASFVVDAVLPRAAS